MASPEKKMFREEPSYVSRESKIEYGFQDRAGSRFLNDAARICSITEELNENEISTVPVKQSIEILREISCGLTTGIVDVDRVDFLAEKIKEQNTQIVQVESRERDVLQHVCRVSQIQIEENVYDIEQHGTTHLDIAKAIESTRFIKDGIRCSADIVRKLSCDIGFDGVNPDVKNDVQCIQSFAKELKAKLFSHGYKR